MSLQVSTGLGAGIPEQRAKNEWIEGVAIWVAVFLVSGVGESTCMHDCISIPLLRSEYRRVPVLISTHFIYDQNLLDNIFVGAANDYAKDKQFRKLNDVKDTIEIKTLRGGQLAIVTNHDIVVGDVVILDAGDKIIADMIMFESHGLVIDEASLTGESDPIKKTIDADPWIRSGTQVWTAHHSFISCLII